MHEITYKAKVADDKVRESLKKELGCVSVIRYPIQTPLETGELGKISHSWTYIFPGALGSFVPIYNDKDVTLEVRVRMESDYPADFKQILEKYGFEEARRKYLG